jgi:hypothetical protein
MSVHYPITNFGTLGLFLIERLQVNALHVWELMLWNEVGAYSIMLFIAYHQRSKR